MSGHTPGPWRVGNAYTSRSVGNAYSSRSAYAVAAEFPGGHVAFVESKENAALIAAAPELLEALRPFAAIEECGVGVQVGDHAEEVCAECSQVMRARAAIAKAEGKP